MDQDKEICDALWEVINENLPEAEHKIWHAHQVWFLDRNPIVGYSKLKNGVLLLFWSGQSFGEAVLLVLLPLSCFRKVAVYFCSDQGAMRCLELFERPVEGMEHSTSTELPSANEGQAAQRLRYVTEEQRRYEQKDQELVYMNLMVVTLAQGKFKAAEIRFNSTAEIDDEELKSVAWKNRVKSNGTITILSNEKAN